MRPIEVMDDDELRPHLAGLRRSWDICIQENDLATAGFLQREIPRVQAEIDRRGA